MEINSIVQNISYLFLLVSVMYQFYQNYKDRYQTFTLMMDFIHESNIARSENYASMEKEIAEIKFDIIDLKRKIEWVNRHYEDRFVVKKDSTAEEINIMKDQ